MEKAVKCVSVAYQPSREVLNLLEAFREMVNYCIHIGLEKNISSRFRLQSMVYPHLTTYGLHSWYVLSAVEIATAILKNHRKAKRKNPNVKTPRARRLVAKIGNQAIKVVEDKLRIPLKPKQYFYIKLHKRARKILEEYRLGSVTLTFKAFKA